MVQGRYHIDSKDSGPCTVGEEASLEGQEVSANFEGRPESNLAFQIQAGQSDVPINSGPEPTALNMGLPKIGSPKNMLVNFATPKARAGMLINPAMINLTKRNTGAGILELGEPKLCQSIYTVNTLDLASEAKPSSPEKSDKILGKRLTDNDIRLENMASIDISSWDKNGTTTPGNTSQGNLNKSNLVFTNVVGSDPKKRDTIDALG
jgi:hypothetical protein